MNAEIEQTLMLKQLLKNRIEQSDRWIPFDLFFNTIMYEPGLGYYSTGSHKIGEGGDFTTAPEISKYFSKAIARQTNRLLTMHDEPSIIEVGAPTSIIEGSSCIVSNRLVCLAIAFEKYFEISGAVVKSPPSPILCDPVE